MVSTIQISNNTKNILSSLKEVPKQTYEEIIINLIRIVEGQKRKQEELLIEECREMSETNLKLSEEWTQTSMDGLDMNEKW